MEREFWAQVFLQLSKRYPEATVRELLAAADHGVAGADPSQRWAAVSLAVEFLRDEYGHAV